MTVDIQTLSADAKKVEGLLLEQPDVPLIQAVKTVLGIGRAWFAIPRDHQPHLWWRGCPPDNMPEKTCRCAWL